MKPKTNRGRNPGTGRKRKADIPLEQLEVGSDSDSSFHGFTDEEISAVVPRSAAGRLAALRSAVSSQSTTCDKDVHPKEFIRVCIVRALRRGLPVKFLAKTFAKSPRYVQMLQRKTILGGRDALRCSTNKRGPKVSPRVHQALAAFQAKIQEDPRRTVRQLSRESGISHVTGLKILKKLGLRSRARRRRLFLTAAGKEKRFNRARILLTKFKSKRPSALVFASDECYIDTDPYRNSRTDRIISTSAEAGAATEGGIHRRKQRAPGLMVWGLVASDGRSQLIIAEHGVKVNTQAYLEVMKEHLAWLKEEYVGAERRRLHGAIWMQDSAPAHASTVTQDFLKKNLGELGINFITKDMWPPSSPEINPLDFGVWAKLKHAVQGHDGVADVSVLREQIEEKWPDVVSPQYVSKLCSRIRPRLELMIKAQGDRFEK